MSLKTQQNDPRFRKGTVFAPLSFMVLFILFIYLPLLVGLLLVARWIIDANHLTFFQNLGIWGDVLMLITLTISWICLVLTLSILPYWLLRAKGQFILAEKVVIIIRVFLFHIFAFPWLCWGMVRNNSPYLRQRYRQKLKIMVNSKKMQERKNERYRRLQKKL